MTNIRYLDDCFRVLELTPEATLVDIHQAYKTLVQVWHPDRFSNNPPLRTKAEVKMAEINAAYTTLVATFKLNLGCVSTNISPSEPPPNTSTTSPFYHTTHTSNTKESTSPPDPSNASSQAHTPGRDWTRLRMNVPPILMAAFCALLFLGSVVLIKVQLSKPVTPRISEAERIVQSQNSQLRALYALSTAVDKSWYEIYRLLEKGANGEELFQKLTLHPSTSEAIKAALNAGYSKDEIIQIVLQTYHRKQTPSPIPLTP